MICFVSTVRPEPKEAFGVVNPAFVVGTPKAALLVCDLTWSFVRWLSTGKTEGKGGRDGKDGAEGKKIDAAGGSAADTAAEKKGGGDTAGAGAGAP